MAVIMKLRQRLGIVVLFVIGLGIIGFLMMDVTSQQQQQQGGPRIVGKVNGQELSVRKFEEKVQESIENYKRNQQQTTIDDETRQLLRRQAWTSYVENTILREKYNKHGIDVPPDEIINLIKGPNPHPSVQRAFGNPETGEYNPSRVLNFVRNLNQAPQESRQQWLRFEDELMKSRKRTKYTSLIQKGLQIPEWQAELEYQIQNKTADIKYIQLPYENIPNENVEVSESELKDYLKEHEEQYQQEASRSIKYVSFDISPSSSDSAEALNWLTNKKEQFENAESDSVFVRLYSDEPFDPVYSTRTELESPKADTLFKVDTGQIIGPYIENDFYKYTKVMDRKKIADSVKASHILLTVRQQGNVQQKRQLLDSLHTLVDEGEATIEELAPKHSQDEATAQDGGSLGWVKKGELKTNLNNALFYQGEEGDVMKVATQNGFHIVKIDSANPTKMGVKTAELAKTIVPSSKTEQRIYSTASKFSSNNRTPAAFDSAASAKNLPVRRAPNLKKNDYTIIGLDQARKLVKWAFESDEGDVSKAFYLGDQYAVGVLTDKKKEGTTPLEDVKTEIEVKVRQNKKAKQLADQLKKAQSDASSLQQVAQKVGAEVQSATNISMDNASLGDAGSEPKVAAKALALNEGELSSPIQGNNGVYTIEVTSVMNTQQGGGVALFKSQQKRELQRKTQQKLMEALKESSKIQDNRAEFY